MELNNSLLKFWSDQIGTKFGPSPSIYYILSYFIVFYYNLFYFIIFYFTKLCLNFACCAVDVCGDIISSIGLRQMLCLGGNCIFILTVIPSKNTMYIFKYANSLIV